MLNAAGAVCVDFGHAEADGDARGVLRNYNNVKEERVAHITLTGDRSGEYVLVEERPDGSLVMAPDTSAEAIRRRLGTRPMTTKEYEHHFGGLPRDGKG